MYTFHTAFLLTSRTVWRAPRACLFCVLETPRCFTHSYHSMDRRLLQTLLIIASLLLVQVVFDTRVDWRRLPSSFSAPFLLEDKHVTTLTHNNTNNSTHWWDSLAHQASRIWQPLNNNYSWCIPQHSRYHAQHFVRKARDVTKLKHVDGIIFTKSPKAASSTGAGISLRIASNVGQRLLNASCTVNYTHPFAHFRGHSKRSPTTSLLWTIVREPSKRQLSIYEFFFLSRKGLNTTSSQEIMDFLATHKNGQFRYIAMRQFSMNSLEKMKPQQQQVLVQDLLQFHHFIAIAERMDESLVAMKMLFQLHHHDLIVLPSKVGYDTRTCRRVNKVNVTNEMEAFIESNFTVDNIDYLLYHAVNQSLDRTIDMLGREQFEQELREHRRLQALAERECMSDILPCFKNGKSMNPKDCYAGDSGCGYTCVDRVLRQDAATKQAAEKGVGSGVVGR